MNEARLLLIDDDAELTALLRELLESDGFAVEAVARGDEGWERAQSGDFDLLILDVMLPGLGGFEVLKRLRGLPSAKSRLPVLMLTARGEAVDRVVGLELGADDYLPKPFDPRELSARIRAILRRASTPVEPSYDVLQRDDIALDVGAREVRRNGELVTLTGAEFDILTALLRAAGQSVSREELSQAALGRRHLPSDRAIDTHVSSVRKKLGPGPNGRERIQNLRGVGYVWLVGGR